MSRPPIGNPLFRQLLRGLVPDVPSISPQEANSLTNVRFIDVRPQAEYEISHLPGAHHMPPESEIHADLLVPDGLLVFYCTVGYRSSRAVQSLLAEQPDIRAWNLYGGIFEWVNRGLPVMRKGVRVREIHPYGPQWAIWLRKDIQRIYQLPTSG